MNREELRKTGISWSLNHPKYIIFHLDTAIETIEISSDIVPINFRYTTLRGLNLYKTEMNSRALYITNESAYKLYSTLQITGEEFKMEWSKKENDKDNTAVLFKLSDKLIIESSDVLNYNNFKINNAIKSYSEVLKLIEEKIKDVNMGIS
jgi:hypothetical protein